MELWKNGPSPTLYTDCIGMLMPENDVIGICRLISGGCRFEATICNFRRMAYHALVVSGAKVFCLKQLAERNHGIG